MALKIGIIALSTCLSAVLSQLVVPTGLPSVSTNFKLIAHAFRSDSQTLPNFNNWEVRTYGTNECDRIAVLSPASLTTANSSFFFSGDSTVNYIHQGEVRMLYIANGMRRALWMGCSVKGNWNFGVEEKDSSHPPRLEALYEGVGQFYACPKPTVEFGTLGQLFYRKPFESTPAPCVNVDLYAVCSNASKGQGDLMVPCCRQIKGEGCLS